MLLPPLTWPGCWCRSASSWAWCCTPTCAALQRRPSHRAPRRHRRHPARRMIRSCGVPPTAGRRGTRRGPCRCVLLRGLAQRPPRLSVGPPGRRTPPGAFAGVGSPALGHGQLPGPGELRSPELLPAPRSTALPTTRTTSCGSSSVRSWRASSVARIRKTRRLVDPGVPVGPPGRRVLLVGSVGPPGRRAPCPTKRTVLSCSGTMLLGSKGSSGGIPRTEQVRR